MNTEQRARFEAWWMSRTDTSNWDLLPAKTVGYDYASHSVQIAFSAFQAAETPLLARIAELELVVVAMADDGWLCHGSEGMSETQQKVHLAALQTEIINERILDKQRISELEGQLANREPFVVKLPEPHKKFMDDESCAQFGAMSFNNGRYGMARFNHGLEAARAAITAAGGVCE